MTGPAHAVYFGAYELVKEAAGGNAQDGKHHPLAAAASGASATIASDALMNPFDGMLTLQYTPARSTRQDELSIGHKQTNTFSQSSNNGCKSTARLTPRYGNALAPSSALKVSQHFTSPIRQP